MTKNAANAVAAVCWHWLKIMAATVDTTHLPLLATVCLSFSSCSALAVVYQHCKALAKTNVATAHKHLLRIMATAAEEHHPPAVSSCPLFVCLIVSPTFPPNWLFKCPTVKFFSSYFFRMLKHSTFVLQRNSHLSEAPHKQLNEDDSFWAYSCDRMKNALYVWLSLFFILLLVIRWRKGQESWTNCMFGFSLNFSIFEHLLVIRCRKG